MTVIDLFSGVGGLSLGFQTAGFSIVLANEIDSEIANAYINNHPTVKMINNDITKMCIKKTFYEFQKKVTVIIGGPPCQGFSQKGSRKSINDDRNFLFKYFYNIVEFIQPDYFLMENVPNLLTTENGLFKNQIMELFGNAGYTIDSRILNAAMFGVPQNRKRAFILGRRGSIMCTLPTSKSTRISVDDAISDLSFLKSGEGQKKQEYLYAPRTEYQERLRANTNILHNHISTCHSALAIYKMSLVPPKKGKEVLPSHMLTKSIYSGTWSRLIGDDVSVTITTRFDTPSSGRFVHPTLNRCITPREAARLQSFPDDFIFYGSKSSIMKQIGNAVPPILAAEIANKIVDDIKLRM